MTINVPGTLIHSGFVGKKNAHQNNNNGRNRSNTGGGGGWKKRRLVLTDQYVAWFKTQSEEQEEMRIPLFSVTSGECSLVISDVSLEIQEPNTFSIEYNQHQYLFQTAGTSDYVEWIQSLAPYSITPVQMNEFKAETTLVKRRELLSKKIVPPVPVSSPTTNNNDNNNNNNNNNNRSVARLSLSLSSPMSIVPEIQSIPDGMITKKQQQQQQTSDHTVSPYVQCVSDNGACVLAHELSLCIVPVIDSVHSHIQSSRFEQAHELLLTQCRTRPQLTKYLNDRRNELFSNVFVDLMSDGSNSGSSSALVLSHIVIHFLSMVTTSLVTAPTTTTTTATSTTATASTKKYNNNNKNNNNSSATPLIPSEKPVRALKSPFLAPNMKNNNDTDHSNTKSAFNSNNSSSSSNKRGVVVQEEQESMRSAAAAVSIQVPPKPFKKPPVVVPVTTTTAPTVPPTIVTNNNGSGTPTTPTLDLDQISNRPKLEVIKKVSGRRTTVRARPSIMVSASSLPSASNNGLSLPASLPSHNSTLGVPSDEASLAPRVPRKPGAGPAKRPPSRRNNMEILSVMEKQAAEESLTNVKHVQDAPEQEIKVDNATTAPVDEEKQKRLERLRNQMGGVAPFNPLVGMAALRKTSKPPSNNNEESSSSSPVSVPVVSSVSTTSESPSPKPSPPPSKPSRSAAAAACSTSPPPITTSSQSTTDSGSSQLQAILMRKRAESETSGDSSSSPVPTSATTASVESVAPVIPPKKPVKPPPKPIQSSENASEEAPSPSTAVSRLRKAPPPAVPNSPTTEEPSIAVPTTATNNNSSIESPTVEDESPATRFARKMMAPTNAPVDFRSQLKEAQMKRLSVATGELGPIKVPSSPQEESSASPPVIPTKPALKPTLKKPAAAEDSPLPTDQSGTAQVDFRSVLAKKSAPPPKPKEEPAPSNATQETVQQLDFRSILKKRPE